MLSIDIDLTGASYLKVIDFAFMKSDAVMLVYQSYGKPYKKKIKEIRRKLKPFLITTRSNQKNKNGYFSWPGTETADRSIIHVDMYRLSEEVKAYIRSAEGLLSWMYPDRPEDISFFKTGECWFFTTTHEKFFDVVDNENEMSKILDSIGVAYEVIEGSGYKKYIEDYKLFEY